MNEREDGKNHAAYLSANFDFCNNNSEMKKPHKSGAFRDVKNAGVYQVESATRFQVFVAVQI
jgi:hypothetical protein